MSCKSRHGIYLLINQCTFLSVITQLTWWEFSASVQLETNENPPFTPPVIQWGNWPTFINEAQYSATSKELDKRYALNWISSESLPTVSNKTFCVTLLSHGLLEMWILFRHKQVHWQGNMSVRQNFNMTCHIQFKPSYHALLFQQSFCKLWKGNSMLAENVDKRPSLKDKKITEIGEFNTSGKLPHNT